MWLKVDDGFVEHAKTIAAGAQLGGGAGLGRAVAVWIEAALYCARNLTNGFIPARVVARLLVDDKPLQVAEALVTARLWTSEPGGFRFHDWDQYNPEADKVKAKRDRDRERLRLLRQGKPDDGLFDVGTVSPTCRARVADDSLTTRARVADESPDPVPVEDPDQKQKSSVPALPRHAVPARMVLEVRSHLLAAVHLLLAQGAPYLDPAGAPVFAELRAEIKTIAVRDLDATWEGRELDALVEAAVARWEARQKALKAREAFRSREANVLRRRGRT